MTTEETRAYLRSLDVPALRERCGIRQATIAAALGVHRDQVHRWETRRVLPRGALAARYARVVAGMERHAAVGW